MVEEMLDIVDMDGNYIKTVTKKEAHQKALLHQAAHC